jgi:hypothetical protein
VPTVVALVCGVALACGPYGNQYCTFVNPADDNSSEFWASSGILGENAMNLKGQLCTYVGENDPMYYNIEYWRCDILDDPEVDEHWESCGYDNGLWTFTGTNGIGHWFWHPSSGIKQNILNGSGSAYFAIKIVVDRLDTHEWYFWSGYAILLDI